MAPGGSVTLTEQDAYGIVAVQGHGTLAGLPFAAISLARVHELTRDEYFVTARAAQAGVTITNHSDCEPLVALKNYGPGNVELAATPLPGT